MKKFLLLLSTVITLLFQLANAQEINKRNWVSHPKIKEIREIFQEVNNSRLVVTTQTCELNDGAVSLVAKLYRDKNNRIRKYRIEGGSEDSFSQIEYYYSITGKHRFTFESSSASNGTSIEKRIYLDEKGQLLYEDYRLLAGPGYAGGFADTYIANPEKHFVTICNE